MTPTDGEHPSALARAFRWLFEDRATGRIVVAQTPNWPLWVFLAALLVEVIAHPAGTPGRVVATIKYAGLTIWALDEIVRGVNPWRRLLGGAALLYEIVLLLRH